jgi:hypothetical protein
LKSIITGMFGVSVAARRRRRRHIQGSVEVSVEVYATSSTPANF